MRTLWNARAATLGLALTTLTACNDSSLSDIVQTGSKALSPQYTVTTLVSNSSSIPAAYNDASLVNPWGLAFGTGPAWVANAGSNTATIYDGNGVAQGDPIKVPGEEPTGLVYNDSILDFNVTANDVTGPAAFIFATESGTLAAWSASEGFGNAPVTVYDGSANGAAYTGLAIQSMGSGRFLYAADFHNARIDTFDTTFTRITTSGGFVDPNLPAGYAPFGIQAIGNRVIVTYAQQEGPENEEEVTGPGLGYVSEFDGSGKFIKRLASGKELNAPWGVALAPSNFGAFSNKLLIGNFGDGRINAYQPDSGKFLGTISTADGKPVSIPGLWAIAFGNGANNQPENSLFFTAGSNDEQGGSYGRIDVATIQGLGGLNGANREGEGSGGTGGENGANGQNGGGSSNGTNTENNGENGNTGANNGMNSAGGNGNWWNNGIGGGGTGAGTGTGNGNTGSAGNTGSGGTSGGSGNAGVNNGNRSLNGGGSINGGGAVNAGGSVNGSGGSANGGAGGTGGNTGSTGAGAGTGTGT